MAIGADMQTGDRLSIKDTQRQIDPPRTWTFHVACSDGGAHSVGTYNRYGTNGIAAKLALGVPVHCDHCDAVLKEVV